MTTVLPLLSTSTSDNSPNDSIAASLLSNSRFAKTLILQPPSTSNAKSNSLLSKRYKAAELGDLLMKKIKTQSYTNSNQDSPAQKEGTEEYDSSMLEEIDSPSTRSDYEHAIDKNHDTRMIDEALLPQRSISTPLTFCQNFLLKPLKGAPGDSSRQVKHALEVLQKKMMIEQNASTLRDLFLKVKLAHDPLVIPPLISTTTTTLPEPPVIKKFTAKGGENEPEIFFGEVEFPFLNGASGENASKGLLFQDNNGNGKKEKGSKRKTKVSSQSSPAQDTFKGLDFELKDLFATRAETQRSESDLSSALKELGQLTKMKDVRKKKEKKEVVVEKGKKNSKKEKEEKPKGRANKREMDSPLLPARRKLTERKKNKWQSEQSEDSKKH